MDEENSSLTEQLIFPSSETSDEAERFNPAESVDENIDATEQPWTRGEKQPARFRDAPFAALFYLQIISVIAVAIFVPVNTTTSKQDDNADEGIPNHNGLLLFFVAISGMSFLLAAASLSIMTMYSQFLVQASLVFSIFMSVLMTVLAILQNNVLGIVFGAFLALVTCCYACAVWRRIPFAAANLKTGLAAVTTNYGVTFIGYFLSAMSVVYSAVILFDMVAVFSQTSQCNGNTCEERDSGSVFLVLLLLALFWTQQVIKNTIHVTIAGTVGEWWFNPANASSFCSGAIWDSFYRAATYSFGSICFGSLIVAVIQTLRQIVHNARQNNDGNNILLCIAECILGCLEDLSQIFNQWAYVYVGLYGYNYIEAGKNVMTLLRQRGWTVIITDDLVSNTLSLICLVLAGISGCAGIIIDAMCKEWLEDLGDSSASFAFMVAFVVGLVISSILMGVVDSAVNTVVVCFAEAPAEGRENHPELSEELVVAWTQIYPNECGF